MSRQGAIAEAQSSISTGIFEKILGEAVAWVTESQRPDQTEQLSTFLENFLAPQFEEMGFSVHIMNHPATSTPFLLAERIEAADRATVLMYGHGDVVFGQEQAWSSGLAPWTLTRRGDRWYGRGTADNKGQLAVNLMGLRSVLRTRGKLGFNIRFLVEMGEELGSPGLREFCADHQDRLRADIFLASDGPRLSHNRPTIFLGSRGVLNFDLSIKARDAGHHSGNWGGLLSDPAMQLCHAIASLSSMSGRINIRDWVPSALPEAVRQALSDCTIEPEPGDPDIEFAWGEPGLTPAERVFAWSSFAVIAMKAGQPEAPVNAIAGSAWARCQLRYVAGVSPHGVLSSLRTHLDRNGFDMVSIKAPSSALREATRADPDNPWVRWVVHSLRETLGSAPAVLPNLGGTIPNDAFSEILGLPTVWIPHSYPGCGQHGPDEHLPVSIAREGLAMMAGLFWDLGSEDADLPPRGQADEIASS